MKLQPKHGDPPIDVVPWIDGFYDNLEFYEWTDFEDKMRMTSMEFHHARNVNNLTHILGAFDVARVALAEGPSNCSTFFPSGAVIPTAQILKLSAACYHLRCARRSFSLSLLPANLLDAGPLTRWKVLSPQLTSDWTTVFLGDVSNHKTRRICAFNLLSPRANILMSDDNGPNTQISAKELCLRYNALFTRKSKDDKNTKHSRSISIAAALIAQAVSSALSTHGGSVFIYNRDVGVALKIVRNYCDKVIVKVSRPFYQDELEAPLISMLALSIYSMNRIKERKTAPTQMAERAEKIALAADTVQDARKTSKRVAKVRKEAEEPSPRKRARRSRTDEVCNDVILGVKEARILQPRVLLGSGNSGRVYLSTWNGKGVAIKEWNGASQEGLECMLEEVEILSVMRTKLADLIGDVIPNVLLAERGAGDNADSAKANGPIIVTEYVGEMLFRDSKNHLRFGDARNSYDVKGSDERQIYEAAMKGLGKLHSKGLLHGSVNLRNLRVERRFRDAHDSSSTWKWRVWWIDFGRSRQLERDPEGKRFQKERKQCRGLFWTRAPMKI